MELRKTLKQQRDGKVYTCSKCNSENNLYLLEGDLCKACFKPDKKLIAKVKKDVMKRKSFDEQHERKLQLQRERRWRNGAKARHGEKV